MTTIDDVTRVLAPGEDSAPSEDVAEPAGLPAGATFGRYVVAKTLGRGGMGVVYLAYDPQLDRGVALKVLRPGRPSADRGRAQERLLREAQVMARLSHPNVVPVYDVGEVDGRVFVAMELIEGRTVSRWVEQERPSWSEVLEVFIGAGRGLAAAHERGLVHRDFKPDNVMLDEAGRPRVMDFGLARTAEEEPDPSEVPSTLAGLATVDGASSRASGSGSLTRTGFVLGTPAYMAPEQHMGAAPDPASDQFSFCVALYESLYGKRPFEGGSSAELCKAASEQRVRPVPPGSTVPSWLRRAVIRGLGPRPEARWPSMDALLAALQQRRRRAQRLRTGVPALALVGVALGGTAWWQTQRDEPCQGSKAALAESWEESQRSQIASAFENTGLPFATDAAARVVGRLDSWGQQWIDEHRQACLATTVRREQSDEALDLRMRCLHGRRRALEGLSAVLASADPSTVERSMTIVDRLPSPKDCADLDALRAATPPPDDPELRRRVDRHQATLERVDALLNAARYTEARAATDEVATDEAALEHPSLRIGLLARLGVLEQAEGKLDEGVRTLEDTVWLAEAQGMDRLAAEVALKLTMVTGIERSEHERGEGWARMADAKLQRLGNAPELRADLLRVRGSLADSRGDYERAAALFEESLREWERIDPDGVGHARALADSGKTHFRAGRGQQAAETFERAARTLVAALGPDHPDVGKAWGNAATAYHVVGDYPRARERFESSLRALETAYGPDHLAVATTLGNLGNVHNRLGDYAAAIEVGRRAVAIKKANLGEVHPRVGLGLNNIALAMSNQGDAEGALAVYREASTHFESLPPDHVSRIEPLIGEGEQLLHLGRAAEAIEPLRRAHALQAAHDDEPTRLALPAFLLARALWEGGGDRAEAIELAATAGERLAGAQSPEDEQLAQSIRAWRSEHPTP